MRILIGLILLISGCSANIPIIPDVVTVQKIPIVFKGNTIHHVREIIAYMDAAHGFLKNNKETKAIPNNLVIVYPKHSLWRVKRYKEIDGKKCSELIELGGYAHIKHGFIRVIWDYKKGAWAYAHERLHQIHWNHPRLNESSIDEQASDVGLKALKKFRRERQRRRKWILKRKARN